MSVPIFRVITVYPPCLQKEYHIYPFFVDILWHLIRVYTVCTSSSTTLDISTGDIMGVFFKIWDKCGREVSFRILRGNRVSGERKEYQ